MGPYVTMVVAIFLIVFAGMSIQSQVKPDPGGTLPATQSTASSSAVFNNVIQACKNISKSVAKTRNFHPVYIIWHSGSTKDEAHIDEDRDVPYIEKRVNVPVVQTFFTSPGDYKHSQTDDNIEIDGKKYEVFYPMKSGELLGLDGQYTSKSRCDPRQDRENRYCEPRHRIYFIDYQLVYLRHLDADGFPIIVPGTADKPGNEYNIMDIYQNTETIDDPDVGDLPDEAFDCGTLGDTPAASSSALPTVKTQPKMQVMIPDQKNSAKNTQMQLEYFVFGQGTADGEAPIAQPVPQLSFEIGCKPAVYLYPPTKQLVNVKVSPKGFLTYTDPLYDAKNGWTVEAYPDGKLSVLNQLISGSVNQYPYLYYESKIKDEFVSKPTTGWVVKSSAFSLQPSAEEADSRIWFDPLEQKFKDLLPKLGLNAVQTKDFIDYWKKALPYSPYYFIGVMDQNNIDQFEPLKITPEPDSVNRVRIYFEKLVQPKEVESPETSAISFQQSAITADSRQPIADSSKFRVVEWGGMIKNDPNHPFTCSQ